MQHLDGQGFIFIFLFFLFCGAGFDHCLRTHRHWFSVLITLFVLLSSHQNRQDHSVPSVPFPHGLACLPKRAGVASHNKGLFAWFPLEVFFFIINCFIHFISLAFPWNLGGSHYYFLIFQIDSTSEFHCRFIGFRLNSLPLIFYVDFPLKVARRPSRVHPFKLRK